jgi:hypothetical protein
VPDEPTPDDGELDHPDDMSGDAEDEETAALRQLFPDGVADEDLAAVYRDVLAPVQNQVGA